MPEIEEHIKELEESFSVNVPSAEVMIHSMNVNRKSLAIYFKAILSRVENNIHRFLCDTEKQLLYSQINYSQIDTGIFEKYRQYVDKKLRVIAPDVLKKFISVYKRMNDEDPESKSQTLLSCRRILKSVADSVYPATNKPIIGVDGKERILSDEKYVARLWQFVAERIKRKPAEELLLTRIEDLGNRIDKLYDLACKGIHADVSQDEVNQCVIQSYLIIGDIMHLAEES